MDKQKRVAANVRLALPQASLDRLAALMRDTESDAKEVFQGSLRTFEEAVKLEKQYAPMGAHVYLVVKKNDGMVLTEQKIFVEEETPHLDA